MNTLFSNAWESRHGACLALREILKKHGGGCGQVRGMDTVEVTSSVRFLWLLSSVHSTRAQLHLFGNSSVVRLSIARLGVRYTAARLAVTSHGKLLPNTVKELV